MSYIHLTKTELVFIEKYHFFGHSGRTIAKKIKRGHEAIFRVIRQLKKGFIALDIFLRYKDNKSNCGRKYIELPSSEVDYINKKVRQVKPLPVDDNKMDTFDKVENSLTFTDIVLTIPKIIGQYFKG